VVRPALLLPLAAALALAPGAAPGPGGRRARAGHRVRYVTAPWSRCIANVQAGRWDAIACVDAREVEDVVYPAEPVGETRPAFFTRRGATWTYRGLASLEEIRLGAIQGYAYDDAIDPWFRAHAGDARRLFLATGTDPLRRLFEMLEAGRIDAILESPLVAAWTAHQPGSPLTGPLRPAGDVGTLVPIYVAFSRRIRDGSALAADLDAGLRALRAEGKLAPLLQRYHVPPWPAAEARRP